MNRLAVKVLGVCLALGAVLVVSGCATTLRPNQVEVTFSSEPPGALLYDSTPGASNGVAWGVAPQTRVWTFPPQQMRDGGKISVTAVWPSGAKKTDIITLTPKVRRGEWKLSRPMDAPGLERDLASNAPKKTTFCVPAFGAIVCE